MRTTLVAVSIRILATALLCASAAPLYAQEEQIVAKVPFDFVVGTAHLSAGTYTVQPASEDPSVVSIKSADGRQVAVAVTIPARTDSVPPANPELIFEKRNNQYVLARLVEADGNERATLPEHEHGERAVVAATSITP